MSFQRVLRPSKSIFVAAREAVAPEEEVALDSVVPLEVEAVGVVAGQEEEALILSWGVLASLPTSLLRSHWVRVGRVLRALRVREVRAPMEA